eukprot:TRINITY_DN1415_c0_g1_i1.p1 TRINITY_DN1415_c0_g1~~TRINITY_DN1415_c0_g1_i1.p1  ORF type:complete len:289 (+),score=63.87 TRINITY_DN1415_c0_g1_i1:54-920(+)
MFRKIEDFIQNLKERWIEFKVYQDDPIKIGFGISSGIFLNLFFTFITGGIFTLLSLLYILLNSYRFLCASQKYDLIPPKNYEDPETTHIDSETDYSLSDEDDNEKVEDNFFMKIIKTLPFFKPKSKNILYVWQPTIFSMIQFTCYNPIHFVWNIILKLSLQGYDSDKYAPLVILLNITISVLIFLTYSSMKKREKGVRSLYTASYKILQNECFRKQSCVTQATQKDDQIANAMQNTNRFVNKPPLTPIRTPRVDVETSNLINGTISNNLSFPTNDTPLQKKKINPFRR